MDIPGTVDRLPTGQEVSTVYAGDFAPEFVAIRASARNHFPHVCFSHGHIEIERFLMSLSRSN
jgi:hypothetical protein